MPGLYGSFILGQDIWFAFLIVIQISADFYGCLTESTGWDFKTKLETVSCWTLCSNLLRVHTINIVGRGQSKDLWHLEASSQSHQNVIFSTQDKCLPCQKKQNMALAQKRVHFGGRARGFRWYLGRSPPGAWSWVFRWHSSFGWVGSSQGRRSKFYCSKVAGEEVLAFWRQPIVPHPKDRGAAWVSKEVDSDLSYSGMWDGHNYCPHQILLADRPELQKRPFNSSQKYIPLPLLEERLS